MQKSPLTLNASWYLKASLYNTTVSRLPTYPYGIVGLIIARCTELDQQSLGSAPDYWHLRLQSEQDWRLETWLLAEH